MMQLKDNSISILVVEDHHITRAGLKLALQQEKRFNVVGDAIDGRSAVDKAMQLRPEIILMDIGLPNMDGLEATWRIKNALPLSRVIMITSHDTDDDISAALGVGADGYCFKDISADDLVDGINAVSRGSSWLDPRIAQKVHSARTNHSDSGSEMIRILCAREREILRLLEQGFDNDSIAARMSVNVNLVDMYKNNILEKLFHLDSRQASNSGSLDRPEAIALIKTPMEKSPVLAANGLSVGTVFADRYAVESFLGEGGMGLVYRARHLHMNRRVAIKVLHSKLLEERHLVRRFKQESMSASTLNHPNVVSIYDFGISDHGQPFLIMDYLDGYALNTVLENETFLNLNRFLEIFKQVCDGLSAAHARDVIHCDLKPSNIMIVKEPGIDNREVVKIVDFGLSVVLPSDASVQSQLTDSFEVYGSPGYMSPEQCAGAKLDARSDIYALGCAMYEAITGQPVFTAKSPFEMFAKHMRQLPERFASACPGRSIPFYLEQIIFKALAKSPSDRYQTAGDLKADLARVVR